MFAALMFPPRAHQNLFFLENIGQEPIFWFFINFCEIWFQIWVLRILRGTWPAWAGNINIPIGILRCLSLPGSHGLLQNSKNLRICAQIAFFTPKLVFPPPGLKKSPRTLCLCRVLGRGRQCRFLVPQMRFGCAES